MDTTDTTDTTDTIRHQTTARQRALTQRRRANGMRRINIWISAEEFAEIEELRKSKNSGLNITDFRRESLLRGARDF